MLLHGDDNQKFDALCRLSKMLNKNSKEYKSDLAESAEKVLEGKKGQIIGCLNNGSKQVEEKAITVLLHGNDDQKSNALCRLSKMLNKNPGGHEYKSAKNILERKKDQIIDCKNNGSQEIKEIAGAVLKHIDKKN